MPQDSAGAVAQSWHDWAIDAVPGKGSAKASTILMTVPTFIMLNLTLNFQYEVNSGMTAVRVIP